MSTPTITQRPLLIGTMLRRAAERAERRQIWRERLDRWSRIAFRFALLAVAGFALGAAVAFVVCKAKGLLL